jgi:hypothetical protein
METEANLSTELVPLTPIRVETALSRYPVHRLARKGNIKIEVSEENARKDTALQWKVSYNSEYGQPGPLAYKLDTLIINRRIEEATRPIPRIIKLGSLHDICRELGISEGKNIISIKNALHQNASAYITSKIRYRAADGSERTLEAGFTRYSVVLTGEKLPDGRKADGVYILLNDNFIQVINGAMTRPLDYDYLKSLPPAPQRFYELLSYQMYAALKYDRPRAKLTYSDFCSHAPQTRHLDWEHVRSQMNKVHRPHLQSGYIAKVDSQQTTDRDGKPDWIMLYQPGPKARAEYRAFTKRGLPTVLEIEPLELEPPAIAEPSELERELIRHGVTATVAAELVRSHPEEKIQLQIEILDWRLAGKKADKIDDPAAYLVGAIRNETGYATPKGFVSKAERERREEAKKAKDRQAAEDRRRKQEEETRQQAEREAADAYWSSLSAEQQSQLEADALADGGDAVRQTHETMKRFSGSGGYLMMLRRDYIVKLMRDGRLPAAKE